MFTAPRTKKNGRTEENRRTEKGQKQTRKDLYKMFYLFALIKTRGVNGARDASLIPTTAICSAEQIA